MCKLLKDWQPSQAALELIALNGIDEKQAMEALEYLKNKSGLSDIDDIQGYNNWNALFIMFCIKSGGR